LSYRSSTEFGDLESLQIVRSETDADLIDPWEYNERRDADEPPASDLIDQCGSWKRALETATDTEIETIFSDTGLSNPPTEFSRRDYVEAVQQYFAAHGDIPNQSDLFDSDILPSSHAFEDLFGSWLEVIRAAGYIPTRDYTDNELLLVIRTISKQVDGSLSVTEFEELTEPHQPSAGPYTTRFGGWVNAKERFVMGEYPSKRTCVQSVRRVANVLNRPPTQEQYQAHEDSEISVPVVLGYFDSWDDVLTTAGLNPEQTRCQDRCVDDFYDHSAWSVIRTELLPSNGADAFDCPFCDGEYMTVRDVANHLQRCHTALYHRALLDEIRHLGAKFGVTPSLQLLQDHGVFQREAYESNYGSWNSAVDEAGFDSFTRPDISQDDLIKDIRRVSTDHLDGATPGVTDMHAFGDHHPETYRNHFDGQFWKALEAAGFEPNRRTKLSKEYLLDEIRRVAALVDDPPPTLDDMDRHGAGFVRNYCSSGKGTQHFECWNAALNEVGFEPNIRHDRTQEEVIDDFMGVIESLGHIPTRAEFERRVTYASSIAYSLFGGWNELIRAAGYEPPHRKDIPDNELLDEIHRLYERHDRAPTYTEMQEDGQFSLKAYKRAFGGWTTAVETAGYEPIQTPSGELHPEWKPDVDTTYYGPNWREQRAKCLGRDGRQCRVCETPQHLIGREPSVHHICPRSEFDRDEYEEMNHLSNLIALCPSCHGTFEGRWTDASPTEFEANAKQALNNGVSPHPPASSSETVSGD